MGSGVTIYCIRHGQTDWNAEKRYQGQADVPMNALGHQQALRNGEVLKPLLATLREAHFVSSPLGRARETMRIVRKALGLPVDEFDLDDRLKEIHYGHWEGELLSDLETTDPHGLASRQADQFGWRPKGGESFADLTARVAAWERELERTTVVTAHGGISRALRCHLLGMDKSRILDLEVPQDKVLKISRAGMIWL